MNNINSFSKTLKYIMLIYSWNIFGELILEIKKSKKIYQLKFIY